jgi:hemerythrin-like domain-containing protein
LTWHKRRYGSAARIGRRPTARSGHTDPTREDNVMFTPATAEPAAPTAASAQAKLGRIATEFEALDSCHQQVLETLDLLARLVELSEQRSDDAAAPALASQVKAFFSGTAHQHHAEEERLVFPPLIDSGDEALVTQVRRLQQDHFWLEQDWRELEPQIDAIARGRSCDSPEALREGFDIFSALYLDHIDLEESLVYPQAKRRLSERANAGVARLQAQARRAQA